MADSQLSDVIREAFRERVAGVTWKQVCADTGIPYSCLYYYLHGRDLSLANLDRIARYCGLWTDGRWTGP